MIEWRPVCGYEDHYEISNDGAVRRVRTQSGKQTCRPCKPSVLRGYQRFILCVENKAKTITAHKLVWETFVGPITPGLQINHKNGVKNDNRLENLEVCTASENTAHAYRVLGLPGRKNPSFGSRNGRATLCEADIPTIKSLYVSGASQQAIADQFGVAQTTISLIIRGKLWRQAA